MDSFEVVHSGLILANQQMRQDQNESEPDSLTQVEHPFKRPRNWYFEQVINWEPVVRSERLSK